MQNFTITLMNIDCALYSYSIYFTFRGRNIFFWLLDGAMMHKDTQISDILQRDDVTDDEKQKLLNAYLERYLGLRRQKETVSPVINEEQRTES